MRKIYLVLMMFFPVLGMGQNDTYIFLSTGLDLKNAVYGGTVNSTGYDAVHKLGFRSDWFHADLFFEHFALIEYRSSGVNLGFVARPEKKLIPVAGIEISIIERTFKTVPGFAINGQIEYHSRWFFIYAKGEYKYRGEWREWTPSVYGGVAIKINFYD